MPAGSWFGILLPSAASWKAPMVIASVFLSLCFWGGDLCKVQSSPSSAPALLPALPQPVLSPLRREQSSPLVQSSCSDPASCSGQPLQRPHFICSLGLSSTSDPALSICLSLCFSSLKESRPSSPQPPCSPFSSHPGNLEEQVSLRVSSSPGLSFSASGTRDLIHPSFSYLFQVEVVLLIFLLLIKVVYSHLKVQTIYKENQRKNNNNQ